MENVRKVVGMLAVLALMGVFLSGCAEISYQRPEDSLSSGLKSDAIVIGSADLMGDGLGSGDNSPKSLLVDGIKAWRKNSYRQAGDLFVAAYRTGKNRGWEWKSDAKIRILGQALRAYTIDGAVEKERETTRYLISELTDLERSYLSSEEKILCYLNTLSEKEPAFHDEVPRQLRIADFVSNY